MLAWLLLVVTPFSLRQMTNLLPPVIPVEAGIQVMPHLPAVLIGFHME
jgi:hypothetical protein